VGSLRETRLGPIRGSKEDFRRVDIARFGRFVKISADVAPGKAGTTHLTVDIGEVQGAT
jgi:hypothetical protein